MCYEQASFPVFAINYGVRNVPKETFRILCRSIIELSKNTIIVARNGEGTIKGYGVARPLPKKYSFQAKNAYIIGPYYVEPELRGQGVGTDIISFLISACGNNREYCAYVGVNNIGSVKAFSNNGFSKVGYMNGNKKHIYIDNLSSPFLF